MSLEKIIAKLKTDFLPTSKKSLADYVRNYELSNYFKEDVREDYRIKFNKDLSEITDEVTERYSSELFGWVRSPVGKGSMALAIANDISAYSTNVPFDNVTALGYVLFAAKTIAELPALKRYVEKSHNWYGAINHIILKPLRYLIPIVGPALESGAFERMVKRTVRKEIARKFIERNGDYESIQDRLKEKLSQPLKEHMYIENSKDRELVEV